MQNTSIIRTPSNTVGNVITFNQKYTNYDKFMVDPIGYTSFLFKV